MTRTTAPAGPMIAISEPGDLARALRFAGRLGHQASLGAARLRDLTDLIRAIGTSFVIDTDGGWISVRELGGGCGPGLEVLAFDRRSDGGRAQRDPEADAWPHLRSQLERLHALGAAVRIETTPGGGTAVWTRLVEESRGSADDAGEPRALDISGLLHAPPGSTHVGWRAVRQDDLLRVVLCEERRDGSPALAAQELLRIPPDPLGVALREDHRQLLERFGHPSDGVAVALVDVDLADHTARITGAGSMALTVLVDGEPVCAGERPTLRDVPLDWDRSLSVLAHTAGIREDLHGLVPTTPAALACATLMREHRAHTPTAGVVAARVEARA